MSAEILNVAFCNRPNWNDPLGGDGVQMIKTKEALERLYKINVEIVTNPDDLSAKYDIIHIFNFITTDVTSAFFEAALRLGKPIASSCIYWDYSYISYPLNSLFVGKYYSKFSALCVRVCSKFLGAISGRPRVFSRGFKNQLRFFVKNSAVILPNSQEEGEQLLKFLSLIDNKDKLHVVINAADIAHNRSEQELLSEQDFYNRYKIPPNYVLQVGRIEYLKNQLNLVYALKDEKEIPIVFVGKPTESKYYKKLLKLSQKRGNVFFIPHVPHDDVGLFYKYAKVHVLLSLRESPGLVSLEAKSYGCPIVTSTEEFVPVKTYFDEHDHSVNPFDISAIRSTILNVYEAESNNIHVHQKVFDWELAAHQTYNAYNKILK
ncbi:MULTISPECIES: glycosyltransferase [Bacteroidales]|uniref:glycosyltransferase n=1 Tax=Bacteroidales TaxID=171549 RepID=UPI00259283C0|nr:MULTISPECIES: glycosyltransferase [Bacteroidales]